MSVKQQSIPAAFEIRFTDASVEVHEIGSDSIPEPFKKRDKIPRNSGSFVSPERLSGADAQSQPTTQKWTKRHIGENPINAPQRNGIFPGQKGRQGVINKKFSENKSVDENAVMMTDAQKEKLTHISTPKRASRSKRTHSSSESLSDHQVVPNNKVPKHRSNTSTKSILKTQHLSRPRRYSSDSKLRPSSGLSTPPTTPPPTPPNKATAPDNRTSIDNSAPSTPSSFSKKPQLNLSSSPPIITPFSADLSESPVEEYPPPATTPTTIPHDEVIIPTVAKKLRKTRQFSENGYTDITDQVENLFDNPSSPWPNARRQGSTPTTRRRPNSRYRSGSGATKSMYEVTVNITDIHRVPRNTYNNHGRDQEYEKAEDNVSFTMYKPVDNEKVVYESESEANRLRKGRRARREEWVMVVRDEDEESAEQTSQIDMYETPASTKFPGTDLSNGNEDVNADMGSRTNAYPFSQQGNPKIVVHPDNVNQRPYTLEMEKTFTQATTEDKKGKKNKKNKKNKKQGKGNGVTDENEDELVKQSKCCCIIC